MRVNLHYVGAASDIWYQEGTKVFGDPIDEYVVEVIAAYFKKPDFSNKSPALTLLSTAIDTPVHLRLDAYRELGEQCLLMASICPNWKRRKVGLGAEYLDKIGASSYDAATTLAAGTSTKQLFNAMAEQFTNIRTYLNRQLYV
jgi:hypothetical protein